MRVVLGGIEHETNTYATESMGTTGLGDFQTLRGDDMLRGRGMRTFLGGFLAALDETAETNEPYEIVPTLWAMAGPSGIIEAAAYEALKGELLQRISDALPVDAVALSMHGAGVVEGIEDLETDLAVAVRAIVGERVPLVVPLDLHGNITPEMGTSIDLMLGVQEYPHIDCFERGVECIQAIPKLVNGDWHPTTHVAQIPVLLPTSTTDEGPAADIRDLCLATERLDGVIDVTFFHGFPYTDIGATGASIVVTTNDDPALARNVASELAGEVWQRRQEFRGESTPPPVAIDLALKTIAEKGGPVVLNETSDNPGGGTPGDGTHLLAALLEADPDDACFGFIFDPVVAAAAHGAGVGATIDVRLGGRHGDLHGQPLDLTVYVKTLTDGDFLYTNRMLEGVPARLGACARLQVGGRGGFDVIVTSRRSQTFDAEIFTLHGIDVRTRSIIGLKSSQHFRAGFGHIATAMIAADSPGLTTLDVTVFDHQKARGPLWPIEPNLEWSP